MIRGSKKSIFIVASLVSMIVAAGLFAGCAKSQQMTSGQDKIDQALEKADKALQEAEAAKAMKSNDAQSAEADAVRAERAADRAEKAAAKAEAIFMQKMKK
jgi:outer membrane PBP1 activator LpoA protein